MIKTWIEKMKTLRLYFVICRFLPYLILILTFFSCLISLNFMMDKNIFGYVCMLLLISILGIIFNKSKTYI
jgi:hypothetical protein